MIPAQFNISEVNDVNEIFRLTLFGDLEQFNFKSIPIVYKTNCNRLKELKYRTDVQQT